MATISLGKVAFTWRGTYSGSATYDEQDVVSYNGTSYVCTSDGTSGQAPVNASMVVQSNWDIFAQGVEHITTDAGELIYYNGSSLTALSIGSTGQVLQVGSNGLPEWTDDTVRRGVRAIGIQDKKSPVMYRRGCALMDDGSVRWWGRGENWMHGTGDYTADRSYPVRVGFPHDAPKMTYVVGQHDYMALTIDSDKHVWIWGQNDHGECGTGDTSNQYVPFCASLRSANSIYNKDVVQYAPMTGPRNHLSVLLRCSDGTIHTCGYNGYGQLGQGDTTHRSTFVQVGSFTNITDIARTDEKETACFALDSNGDVWSWGRNNYGQLGHGDTTQRNTPTKISALDGVTITKIGCGRLSAWAVDSNNNLYTWGYNGYGNLGYNGSSTNSVTYTPTVSLTGVDYAVMGPYDYDRTYAVKTDGTLWATGDNSYGCLGVAADTTDRQTFQQCKRNGSASDNVVNVDKLIVGGTGSYNFVVYLDDDGVAWSCGYSGNGQLGRATAAGTNYWFYPVRLNKTITDIATVGSVSEGGVIFLTDDGSVYQTGYAGESQLPEDDDEYIQVPMPVIF